jgi:murein DD-endopeptidase MepM/ murein hydrolase activator NlpD
MKIFFMPFFPFEVFLKSLHSNSLFDSALRPSDYIPLDLSIHNTQLKAVDVSSSDELERFIWNFMHGHKAKVAYGGYLEERGIYKRSAYFNQENPDTERNIHLGLDFWIGAETPIYAPLSGTLHSFKNNANYGDYGPTLVLKHRFNSFDFYTLYGHLSLASLRGKEIGAEVKQGEQIATLGIASVNGDYPPHLHFQIIKDIQNFEGDYPGVSHLKDLEFYKANCPDPALLFGLK